MRHRTEILHRDAVAASQAVCVITNYEALLTDLGRMFSLVLASSASVGFFTLTQAAWRAPSPRIATLASRSSLTLGLIATEWWLLASGLVAGGPVFRVVFTFLEVAAMIMWMLVLYGWPALTLTDVAMASVTLLGLSCQLLPPLLYRERIRFEMDFLSRTHPLDSQWAMGQIARQEGARVIILIAVSAGAAVIMVAVGLWYFSRRHHHIVQASKRSTGVRAPPTQQLHLRTVCQDVYHLLLAISTNLTSFVPMAINSLALMRLVMTVFMLGLIGGILHLGFAERAANEVDAYHEDRSRQRVMETRREYVRLLCHELRNPASTVALGLTELRASDRLRRRVGRGSPAALLPSSPGRCRSSSARLRSASSSSVAAITTAVSEAAATRSALSTPTSAAASMHATAAAAPAAASATDHDAAQGAEAEHAAAADRAGLYAVMESALASMQRLLSDFLTVDKLDAGFFSIELTPFCVAAWVHETVASFAGRERCEGKAVRCDAEMEPLLALSDPHRLQQVIVNFVRNAIAYGGSTITVRVRRLPAPAAPHAATPRESAVVGLGAALESPSTLSATSLAMLPPVAAAASMPFAPVEGTSYKVAAEAAALCSVSSSGIDCSCGCQAGLPDVASATGTTELLRVEVHDDGAGIAPEMLPRLFRRFQQNDSAETSSEVRRRQRLQGTGLGLHICHEIVRRLGGRVGVASEARLGTTFWFEVPVSVCRVVERPPMAVAAAAMPPTSLASATLLTLTIPRDASTGRFVSGCSAGTSSGVAEHSPAAAEAGLVGAGVGSIVDVTPRPGALRILVVDDSRTVRTMTVRTLRRQLGEMHIATDIVEAGDGSEAVSCIAPATATSPAPFDVVLLDHNMPIMSGSEAAGELRKRGFAGTIIGVTGNALAADVEAFKTAGCDAVLTKPVDVSELVALVASATRLVAGSR